MSTITTINSTDQVNNSRAVINTNFSNLNTDKLEASTTATLTNKTFDANGTGNSLSNVEMEDLKSTAKTGNATKAVTGTAGTDGNLLKWDSNSNAVDSTFSVSDPATALANSATTLPTEAKVMDYVDSVTKQMWVPVVGADTLIADMNGLTLGVGDKAHFMFKMPTGYTAITSALVYFVASDTGDFDMIPTTTHALLTEAYNATSETGATTTKSCTQNIVYSLDVSDAMDAVAEDSLVGLSVEFDALASGAGAPIILGFQLIWS